MSKKTISAGVEVYMDGKQVENTIKAIEAEMRKLNKEVKSCTIGSDEYIKKTAQMKQLNGILAQHRAQIKSVGEQHGITMKGMVEWFNKYAAVIASVTAVFVGFTMKIQALRKMANERMEAKADVKALTGLDDDSINWLEKKAIELSTTTTKEGIKIRESASDILEAYKLVGSAKPDLLTNKEALAEVTKQSMILAQASGMQLKDAVDAVTLSMNEYGAAAKDAGRYANVMAAGSKYGAAAVPSVTAAVIRAGVAASSANVPIEQLVGSIEMLAEKGIKDEVAGTGLKRFLGIMQKGADETNPKIVGLQTALENLKAKGLSYKELNKMFGEKAVNVASVLVNNAEKVNYYTKAVTGTNVAIEQAGIMSKTAQARIAQLKNEMNEEGIALIKRLNPALSKFISLAVRSSKAMIDFTNFILDNKAAFIGVTATLALYLLWTNRTIIALKAMYFWEGLVSKGGKTIKTLFKDGGGWIGIFTVAVGVAISLLINYINTTHELTESQKAYNRIMDNANEKYAEQASKIQLLSDQVHNNKLKLEERQKALDELKKIIPGYNAQLSKEGKLMNDNTQAIKDYLVQLNKKLILEASKDELAKLYKERLKAFLDYKNQYDDWAKKQKERKESAHRAMSNTDPESSANVSVVENRVSEYNSMQSLRSKLYKFNELGDAIRSLNNEIKKMPGLPDIVTEDTQQPPATNTNNPSGGGGKDKKDAVQHNKELEAVEAEYLQKEAELKKQYYESDVMTHQKYADRLESLEMDKLDKEMEIASIEPQKRQEIANKIQDMKVALIDKLKELDQNSVVDEEQSSDDEIAKLKKKLEQEQEIVDYALKKGIISQQRHDELMKKMQAKFNSDSRKEDEKAADKRLAKKEEAYENDLNSLKRSRYKESMTDEAYERKIRQIREKALEQMLQDDKLSSESRAKMDKELQELRLTDETETDAKLKNIAEQRIDVLKDGFVEMGTTLGAFLTEQKKDVKAFAKDMIKIILDTLEKYYLAAVAERYIKDVGTLSFAGLAKAALETAKLTLIFETAKAAIGNLYTGGFTDSGEWNEPKGIVHSNEFVANRYAVANPSVLPVLRLIDNAQRNNTISNLTASDIAATSLGPTAKTVASLSSNHLNQGDNVSNERMIKAMDNFVKKLSDPLMAYCYINGKGGIKETQDLLDKMNNNIKR